MHASERYFSAWQKTSSHGSDNLKVFGKGNTQQMVWIIARFGRQAPCFNTFVK